MQNKILVGSDEGQYAPGDGTRTITLSQLSFTPNIDQIAYIYNKTQDKLYYAPAEGIAKCTISGLVITIDSTFGVLATTDDIHIQLWLPARAYDGNQDEQKTIVDNPLWNRYADAQNLVSGSNIGAVDDTWIDQAAEIDCRGFNTITLWVILTVNDSTGNQLQVLRKHESGGSDEYVMETPSDYQKTIGDASIKVAYDFEVDNTTPFIQIQTKATDVDTGGGTKATVSIEYTLGYK